MSIQSPFGEQEKAAGAVIAERFGVEVPTHFGDPDKEYTAVHQAVGLVDGSFRGLIEVTGGDRLRWLNGQVTGDVKDLKAGEGKLAAVLDVKGHILADAAVYGLPDLVWVNVQRDRAQLVRDTFDRYIIADDVMAEDASGRYAHLMVVGEDARALMSEVVGPGVADLAPWHHAEAWMGSLRLRVIASRWLAKPGYDVIVPSDEADRAWEALMYVGQSRGLLPVGMAALDLLRVEAGWSWFGVDFDDTNLLMESLTRDYVSFTKGCYIGQEVVIRVEHQGHVNKKLCGLMISGDALPPQGAAILAGDRKVGTLTSAVRSPALKSVIALGYVRREVWDPGTKLRIAWGDQSLEAEVSPLPFIA
ncbi:MAG TPA: glycine cleavage T C-terminal barrel domain-containing protein [Candidatus Methylomirabilis sp.]|nr:glycine cleavage T C-terminal barrel domain-containing protein [Candidatus Methylomirabilis sp.]